MAEYRVDKIEADKVKMGEGLIKVKDVYIIHLKFIW